MKFPRNLPLAAALCSLLILAGCGGGGGGGSNHLTTTSGGGGTSGPVAMNVLIPPGAANDPDITQFVLNNSQAPVSGATFQVEWSSFDPDGTNYNWTYSDSEIALLPSGEKANFVFWANADSSSDDCSSQGVNGDPTAGNCAIPLYVWNQLGSSNYVNCTPANANGPQRIPNYFAPAFQTNYQNFIKAAIAHYASNSQVGYIRFGLGRGGETIPVGDWDSAGDPCAQQFANWGLTDATINVWENYLQTMLTFEGSNNPSKKQLMVGITPMNGNAVPEFVAQTAVPLGIGFGSQGLESSDVNNCAGSTADWCELFHTYHGQVPLELQTIGQSCPSDPNSCPTGSLVTLLPFAVSNDTTILEIYYQDWLTAFDSGYSGGFSSAYASVFTAAAAGQ